MEKLQDSGEVRANVGKIFQQVNAKYDIARSLSTSKSHHKSYS